MSCRCSSWVERRALLAPTLAFRRLLLQRTAKHGRDTVGSSLCRCRRSTVRHRREHLWLCIAIIWSTVLDRSAVLALEWPSEGGQGRTWWVTEGNLRISVVIRKKSTGTMNCARDPRRDRLVNGNGAGAAMVRCRLVPVVGLSISIALSIALFTFSLLVPTGHLLTLL
jgi:hypothetical protein